MSNLTDRYDMLKDIMIGDNSKFSNERKLAIANLISNIECNLGFLESPASTKYHCSYRSGLLEHSCNVAETALRLKKLFGTEYSNEQVVMCALFHDIGKCEEYIQNEPTPKQKEYGYPGSFIYNTERIWMDHHIRSLKFIADSGLKLTDEEWQAIAYHDEPYYNQNSKFRQSKLLWIIQSADYYSTMYLEKGSNNNNG